MSALENTLVTRVSEFVATMNEVAERSGVAQQPGRPAHQLVPHRRPARCWPIWASLPRQFEPHGRALAEAVALIDRATAAPTTTFGERRAAIETLVGTLDTRTDDIEQRLKRFSSLLDEVARRRLRPRPRDRPHHRGFERRGRADPRAGAHARQRSCCAASTPSTAAKPTRCSPRPRSASPKRCRA